MRHCRDIEPITGLKRRAAELIRTARETGTPVVITQNGKATAVIQDVETYERDRRALLLLRVLAQGDAQLREGEGIDHAAVRARILARNQTSDG